MTKKSLHRDTVPDGTPTTTVEKTRLENMKATKAQEALDKAAAGRHPLKGDIDRAGFDLGGINGEPTDAGLRAVEAPVRK